MLGMKSTSPNPAGKRGKPISLAPYTFDQVLAKALTTPAPSKAEQKAKPAKKKSAKERKPRRAE